MLTGQKIGLSGNMLKWIALVCMLIDHTGYILFPNVIWLRIIGRIAFPIFAYLMAEGCIYTRRPLRHFMEVFVLGVICQVVNQIAEPYPSGIYLNILLTFSVSIALCNLLRLIPFTALKAGVLVSVAIPLWLTIYVLEQFGIVFDYGFWGIILPPVLVLMKKPWQKLLMEGILLCFLAQGSDSIQWWSLLALLPLALYNGTRGSKKLKYFFYLFYPLHLAALYGIYWGLRLWFR